MTTPHDYDLFVIGAGSGGVRAARIAAGHGARVAIAEEDRFGGTCVIRGCVPKKLMVYASRFSDDFVDAPGFGWTVGPVSFDWGGLIAAKDKEIGRLENIYRTNLEKSGVEIFAERAELAGTNAIRLKASGRTLSAANILIATGGYPNIDRSLPGHELAITSNEVFHLKQMPQRVLVVGGGYIAVEFAGIFAGLGAQTTLAYRGEKILRGFDDDLRDELTAAYGERGVDIRVGVTVAKLEKGDQGIAVTLSDGQNLVVDQVMSAIGRAPNTGGLGLEEAGVKLGRRGEIIVDSEHRSSVPSIFAVGDVTDRVNLTPVAIREGHAFADTQFGPAPVPVDHETIPTAVFSTPEIGTVGLTEAEAAETYGQLDIYKSRFTPMKATISGRNEKMLMKLIVDAASDRVVGCHIVGEDAAEIVQMAAIAMKMGATKKDFDATMALHPSAGEELVTMRQKFVPAA